MNVTAQHAELMDQVYGWQRHIYDLTRKYYLFGRDQLLSSLDCKPNEHVLEVGCGTGRNLLRLARMHPDIRLFGLDASQQMLDTAAAKARSQGLSERLIMRYGLAEELDAQRCFGQIRPFDVVFFSYSLSMIPDWQGALRQALANLRRGGRLAIVDFWDQRGLPNWSKRALRAWLQRFHVEPREELFDECRKLAAERGSEARLRSILRGYSCLISVS